MNIELSDKISLLILEKKVADYTSKPTLSGFAPLMAFFDYFGCRNGNLRHVTLYRNGKYIIAGASSEKEVFQIYEVIYKKLSDAGYF